MEEEEKIDLIMSSLNYFSSHIKPLYKATHPRSKMPLIGISLGTDLILLILTHLVSMKFGLVIQRNETFFKARLNFVSLNFK
jgi:hypothetical protein